MYYISMLLAAWAVFCLVSCSAMLKDKAEIEQIADDILEEIAEDLE